MSNARLLRCVELDHADVPGAGSFDLKLKFQGRENGSLPTIGNESSPSRVCAPVNFDPAVGLKLFCDL
jgi:hypothetical protein